MILTLSHKICLEPNYKPSAILQTSLWYCSRNEELGITRMESSIQIWIETESF